MPWQACSKMDERLRFVARLLEGEKMAVLYREFDISRKTGYKIFQRYKDCGVKGLTDRSRLGRPPTTSSSSRPDSTTPTELYRRSPRPYRGLDELHYPFHDWTITVTQCGRICMDRRKINLSHVFAGQNIGVKQVNDRVWLVSFMHYDLGYFDDETCRREPLANPFEAKVLPMCPE